MPPWLSRSPMRSLSASCIYGRCARVPPSGARHRIPRSLDWRSRAKSFSGLEAYDPTNITVGMGDEARMLRGARVTAGFFRLLGVRISAGRDFLDEDATTGAAVAIVSDRFSRSVAGGIALDPTDVIIGRLPMMLCGVIAATALATMLRSRVAN